MLSKAEKKRMVALDERDRLEREERASPAGQARLLAQTRLTHDDTERASRKLKQCITAAGLLFVAGAVGLLWYCWT